MKIHFCESFLTSSWKQTFSWESLENGVPLVKSPFCGSMYNIWSCSSPKRLFMYLCYKESVKKKIVK
jgi:hypothetical protein